MSDSDFDPDDIYELEGIFGQIVEDNETGYLMEFSISKLAAKELLDIWNNAMFGDPTSIRICLDEYGKIMTELEEAIITSEE